MEIMENYLGEPYSLEDSDSSCYDYTHHSVDYDYDDDDYISEASFIVDYYEWNNDYFHKEKQSIFTAIREERLKDLKKLIDSSNLTLLKCLEYLSFALSSNQFLAAKLILQNSPVPVCLEPKHLPKFDEKLLDLAVRAGNEKVVKLLINEGANVHLKIYNMTSILIAVKKQYAQIVEHLLIGGADVNSKFSYYYDERTLLHHAVENGNEPIIKLLVQFGADVDAMNNDGLSPLHIATQKGFLEITKYLLQEGANTDPQVTSTNCENGINTRESCTPLQTAIQNRYKEIIQLLLESGSYVDARDKNGNTVLKLAVETRCPEIVTYVLDYCPDLNDENNKAALYSAIFSTGTDNDRIILEILLNYGFALCSEDKNNSYLLFNAVRGNYLEIARLLLMHGADINQLYDGNDPYFTFCSSLLHVAVIRGQMNMVNLLIDYGASLDARNIDGKTPLLFATALSESNIATVLLKNGAKIFNNELLILAIKNCSIEVIKTILKKGVDVNEKISFGKELCEILSYLRMHSQIPSYHTINPCEEQSETALHAASDLGCYEVVKILLEHGAGINSANHTNMTPLFFSARSGHSKTAKLLIEKGANITFSDRSGRTVLHEAAGAGHGEVVKLLIELGAAIDVEDVEGKTPLFISVEANHWKVVEVLLKSGATIEKSVRAEVAALDVAIQHIDEKIVQLLLEYGAKAVECRNFESSLIIFINKQNPEIVQFLLKSGANINSTDWLDQSVLSLATEADSEEIVKLLLDYGSEKYEAKDYTQPFLISAQRGNLRIIERLLKSNANIINSADKKGRTALFNAAEQGQTQTVEVLLKYGAAVNCKTSDSETPLSISTSKGHLDTVQVLLNADPIIDSTDSEGRSPLYIATREGYVEIVKLLLKYNAKTEIKTLNGETPLSVCASKGRLDIFKVLVKSTTVINSIDKEGKSPLYNASKEGHTEIVKQLLKYGAEIDIQTLNGETPLFISTSKGYLDIVETLLTFNANLEGTNDKLSICTVSEKSLVKTAKRLRLMKPGAATDIKTLNGETPLLIAANNGHLNIVEILLKFGAEINSMDKNKNTPLHKAVERDHAEIIKLLLKYGAATEIKTLDGETPLTVAVSRNKFNSVQMLLKSGANTNSADNEGKTAIHHVLLFNDNYEIMELLLQHGAEIDYKDVTGRTTLNKCIQKNSPIEILETLLKYGANTESTDCDGNRPLHHTFMIRNCNTERVKLLIQYGANVDAKGKKGETPLFNAVRYRTLPNCIALLEAGANINAADSSGTTLLYTAVEYCSGEIVNFLLNHGAEIDSKTLNDIKSALCDEDADNRSNKKELWGAETIAHYIVKMKVANMWKGKGTEIMETVSKSVKIKMEEFKNKCEVEITKMISEYIADTKVTFYEILTKNLEQLALIAKNDSATKILKTRDHEVKFPIYADIIEIHIKKGVVRKNLIEQGLKDSNFFMNRYGGLPYELVEKVLSYLSNEELRVLIHTCTLILENLELDLFDD